MTGGIYILLGSNQGDKRNNIFRAVELIQQNVGNILNKSSQYKTAAWGKEDQPDFLNMVIEIESNLKPSELLKVLLNIENKIGRIRKEKWEARIIDIDILYYDQITVDKPKLKIPHPEIQNRRFTLVPLVEISADFIHPILNKSNFLLLNECFDDLQVIKITNSKRK